MVSFIPAFTIGEGVTKIFKLSNTETQFPLKVEVNLIVTLPLAMSAGVSWYIELKLVVEGENNPDPLVVHNPVVEPPVTVPVTATVGLFAHTKTSGLKITTGAFVKFIFKLSKVWYKNLAKHLYQTNC